MSEVPEEVWSLASLAHFHAQGNPYLLTPPSEHTAARADTSMSSKSRNHSKESHRSNPQEEILNKEDRVLSEKANLAIKADELGFVAEEWVPSPFQVLDLSGCRLQGLPLALVAGANTSFTSGLAFERQRMKEIMAESDSSSEEVCALFFTCI